MAGCVRVYTERHWRRAPRFRDGLQAESNSDSCKSGVPGFGMDDAFLHFTGEPKHP